MKLACPYCLRCRKYEAPQIVGFAEGEAFTVEGLSRCCKKPIRVTFEDEFGNEFMTVDRIEASAK